MNLPVRPNAQPNQEFQDLLQQGKMRLANKLGSGPTEGEQFADFASLVGAGFQGGNEFRTERQRQTGNQFAQDEQLRQVLATEDERSLQVASQVLAQQKQEGDQVAASFDQFWPDENQQAAAARIYMLALMDRVAEDPNITDDDQIPVQERLNLLTQIAGAMPAAMEAGDPLSGIAKLQDDFQSGRISEEQYQIGVDALSKAQTQIVLPSTKGETKFRETVGVNEGNRIENIRNVAEQANRDKSEIERMRIAIESGKFTTGSLDGARVWLGRMADYFVGPELTQDPQWIKWVGDAAKADTIDAASKKLAVAMAQEGGRNTNMMLGLIVGALPALSRTPEGNLILLEVMDRTADRDIVMGDIANIYAKAGSLQPEGQESYFDAVKKYDKNNPVITDDLRKRIREETKKAPRSFKDAFNAALPPGVPKDSVLIGVTDPGGLPIYRLPDGREQVYE